MSYLYNKSVKALITIRRNGEDCHISELLGSSLIYFKDVPTDTSVTTTDYSEMCKLTYHKQYCSVKAWEKQLGDTYILLADVKPPLPDIVQVFESNFVKCVITTSYSEAKHLTIAELAEKLSVTDFIEYLKDISSTNPLTKSSSNTSVKCGEILKYGNEYYRFSCCNNTLGIYQVPTIDSDFVYSYCPFCGALLSNGYDRTHTSEHKVYWKVWEGWKGNHDNRVEDAKCSSCGFTHCTVKGISELPKSCPNCNSNINQVDYGDNRYEDI